MQSGAQPNTSAREINSPKTGDHYLSKRKSKYVDRQRARKWYSCNKSSSSLLRSTNRLKIHAPKMPSSEGSGKLRGKQDSLVSAASSSNVSS